MHLDRDKFWDPIWETYVELTWFLKERASMKIWDTLSWELAEQLLTLWALQLSSIECSPKQGKTSIVYEVSWHDSLVCKVLKKISYNELEALQAEYLIWDYLRKNGISTPIYVWIYAVITPDSGKSVGMLMEKAPSGSILIKQNIPVWWEWKWIKNTTSEQYIRGYGVLCEEIKKIQRLPMNFIGKGEWGCDFQWLYDPCGDKIYLIDFGEMIMTPKLHS